MEFLSTQYDDKVLVALSGGVDSAVCVKILQQQGFVPQGLVISFSPAHAGAVAAAQRAADELGIQLHVAHCEPRFDDYVIQPFCEAYANGETPNPCILCNPNVKFHILQQEADRLGITYFATGHYVRTVAYGGGFRVARAQSTGRDQSYMLYRLGQPVLSRLCTPLGEFEKPEIRAMAEAFGLSCASSPDSQEICFIPDGDYAAYIHQRGIQSKQGQFISPEGKVIGAHKGVLHYTVGQRRGLGIALGKPVFVKRIQPDGNIRLGYSGEEYSSGVILRDTCTPDNNRLENNGLYFVKLRSVAQPVPCHYTYQNSQHVLQFEQPQRAAAPGQHAVLYRDDTVMGGGIIEEALD